MNGATIEIPAVQYRRYRELVTLILDEMPIATTRDLAVDGPVPQGDDSEEVKVWERIERKARQIRNGANDNI